MNTHGIIHKQTKQYRYKTIKTTIKPSHHKNLSKVNLKLKLFYVLCVCMQASLVGLLVEFHTHMLCVKPFYLIRETFSWVDMCFWQWLVTSWVWWDLGAAGWKSSLGSFQLGHGAFTFVALDSLLIRCSGNGRRTVRVWRFVVSLVPDVAIELWCLKEWLKSTFFITKSILWNFKSISREIIAKWHLSHFCLQRSHIPLLKHVLHITRSRWK